MALKTHKKHDWMTDGLSFNRGESEEPVPTPATTVTPPSTTSASLRADVEEPPQPTPQEAPKEPEAKAPVQTVAKTNPTVQAEPVEQPAQPAQPAQQAYYQAPAEVYPPVHRSGPLSFEEKLRMREQMANSQQPPVYQAFASPQVMPSPIMHNVVGNIMQNNIAPSWTKGVRASKLSCSIPTRLRQMLDNEVLSLNIKSINDLVNILLEQYFEEKERYLQELQKSQQSGNIQ